MRENTQQYQGEIDYGDRVGKYKGMIHVVNGRLYPIKGKLTYCNHHNYKNGSYCKGTFAPDGSLTECEEAKLNYLDGSRLEGRRGGKINAEGQYSGPCIYYCKNHTDELPHYMAGLLKNDKWEGLVTLVDKSNTYHCQWRNGKVGEGKLGTIGGQRR